MATSRLATMRKMRKMDFPFILTGIDGIIRRRGLMLEDEIRIGIEVNDGGMIPLNSSKLQYYCTID
jgi:hypothetical protein